MKLSFIRRHAETVVAPLAVASLYAALIITSEAGESAQVIAALFFFCVLGLWVGFRRLRVHAAASRLVAIGRPDEMAKLVEREVPRRWTTGTRAPLHVFAAMGHNLAGEYEAAKTSLATSGIRLGAKEHQSWQLLWAAADIHARTALGDVAGAKASYARTVAPHRALPMTGGVELVAIECEARIALAEGDAARARELVTPMTKDIRLGPGARAQLHALLAQALAAEGNAADAAVQAAKARDLAPRCTFPHLPA
jgi:hypothetical protein